MNTNSSIIYQTDTHFVELIADLYDKCHVRKKKEIKHKIYKIYMLF